MTGFFFIWIGQIVSVLASSMSHFGLTIWMYQQTESATAMGLMQVFFITPFLIMSPFAGVMVDRHNRKLMMMVSDFAAILATGTIFILYASGRLEFWHLYIAAALNGIGNTFQWPAYSAAISTMVPKEQLGRVNGLMSTYRDDSELSRFNASRSTAPFPVSADTVAVFALALVYIFVFKINLTS
jgi:MFS family permease